MELNREQIVKALECCFIVCYCNTCPYYKIGEHTQVCTRKMAQDALALIRELTVELDAMRGAANSYKMDNQRLTEENERLKAKIVEEDRLLNDRVIESVNAVSKAHLRYTDALEEKLKTVKADTVRKMQERLKEKSVEDVSLDGRTAIHIINAIWVDQIAKEMLEEVE